MISTIEANVYDSILLLKIMEHEEKMDLAYFLEDQCKFCTIDDECPHGITCYGYEPIFPPCDDCYEDYFIEEDFDEWALENPKEFKQAFKNWKQYQIDCKTAVAEWFNEETNERYKTKPFIEKIKF